MKPTDMTRGPGYDGIEAHAIIIRVLVLSHCSAHHRAAHLELRGSKLLGGNFFFGTSKLGRRTGSGDRVG